jgi:hypothetical protein
MAFLDGSIRFTGSLENLSAYIMRGQDKIIVRTKGGANKNQIATKASFETTRKLNAEWIGVTRAAKEIRKGLADIKLLADYNISGPINALVKKIQTADTDHPKGKRSILFSRHPDFFSGFQFNRQTIFDTVIRQPIAIQIERSTGFTAVTIPALHPAINFFSHPKYAYYRMIFAVTAISDQIWHDAAADYFPAVYELPGYASIYTDWLPANSIQPATDFQLIPNNAVVPHTDMMMIFAGGIQYGMPYVDGSIQPVPYAGTARILKTV